MPPKQNNQSSKKPQSAAIGSHNIMGPAKRVVIRQKILLEIQ